MWRTAVTAAIATGGFCSIFAIGIDAVTDALNWMQVMVISFVSGFLGSLFATIVLGKSKVKDDQHEG